MSKDVNVHIADTCTLVTLENFMNSFIYDLAQLDHSEA